MLRAKQVDPGFVSPVVPYDGRHVVGLMNEEGVELRSDDLLPLV